MPRPPKVIGSATAAGPAAESRPDFRQGERDTHLQERLRQLGATYYVLESWGAEGRLYRFHCRVAIGGSPDYTRHFEATDPDPLHAMGKVVQQVEAWLSGQ